MRLIFFLAALLFSFMTSAQTPQFAVVRPDGTTYICPTLDSAYNKAVPDDIIYLPGGSFTLSGSIDKRIKIFGAGSDEDSCFYTGPTILASLSIGPNASNGSMEGIKVGSIVFNSPTSITNYTIKRCYFGGGISFVNSTTVEFLSVTNCYLGASTPGGGGSNSFSFYGSGTINNSSFSNNRITSDVSMGGISNLFTNNIFFPAGSYRSVSLFHGSTYQNNIFQAGMGSSCNNSFFYNNINGNPQPIFNNIIFNSVGETPDLTFINPGIISIYGWINYDKHNDYHLKASSLGKNTGTDATDRGDYGGVLPWAEGMVPSNPHIYFKQVAPVTNSSGQLPVQFKVRTNN